MKYLRGLLITIFLLIFLTACNESTENQTEVVEENFLEEVVKESDSVQVQASENLFVDSNITMAITPKKEELIGIEELIGKYRKWNEDLGQYDLIEIKKKKNQFEVDFYVENPEVLEYDCCWTSIVKSKGNTLHLEPTDDEVGFSIFLKNNKLIVKWLPEDQVEYYSKY